MLDLRELINDCIQKLKTLGCNICLADINKFLEEFFMKIPKRVKAPIIIKDDIISGFTIDDIENNLYKVKSTPKQVEQTTIDHDSYRRWLKDTNMK